MINNITEIIGLIFRIATLFLLMVILYGTNKKSKIYRKKSESIISLINVYRIAVLGCAVSLIVFLMRYYYINEAYFYNIYVFTDATTYMINIIATVLSLVFIYNAFLMHPNSNTMKLIYIFTGFVLGIVFISIFSVENWHDLGLPPTIIILFSTMMVIISSVCVTYYAKKSYNQISTDNSHAIEKASMLYYYKGSLIFCVGLFFILVMTALQSLFDPIIYTLIMDNITLIMQIINTYYTYVAFFRPNWFKEKYSITKRNADMYVDLFLKNKK